MISATRFADKLVGSLVGSSDELFGVVVGFLLVELLPPQPISKLVSIKLIRKEDFNDNITALNL